MRILNRDFTQSGASLGPGWNVERMTWSAMGGPDQAVLTWSGEVDAVAAWEDLLRRPVEIYGPEGQAVWWGFVSTVELRRGGLALRSSLDEMSNSVRYKWVDWYGEQFGQVKDETSAALYGEKETFIDLGETEKSRADAAAAGLLRKRDTVRGPWEAGAPGGEESAAARVRLELRGWWHSLGWKYFIFAGQGEVASTVDWAQNDSLSLGSAASNTKVLQVLADDHGEYPAWKAVQLDFFAGCAGTPTDMLRASLVALDASGAPTGSPLDTVEIFVGWTGLVTLQLALNKTAALAPGTPFGVQFSRSGAVSSTNYYKIGLFNPAPAVPQYPVKVWNGSSWVQRTPAASAVARVRGVVETTALAQFHAGKTRGGQFLDRVVVEDASGLNVSGQNVHAFTCRREIEDLLACGTSDGQRLLAVVTPERVLRIFKAQAMDSADLVLREDGSLCSLAGPLLPYDAPVGRWARLAAWPDARPVFVEKVTWEGEFRLSA